MTIQEKIAASHIQQKIIAEAIGLSKGTFHNKYKGNNNARFSIGEIEKIVAFLKKICESING